MTRAKRAGYRGDIFLALLALGLFSAAPGGSMGEAALAPSAEAPVIAQSVSLSAPAPAALESFAAQAEAARGNPDLFFDGNRAVASAEDYSALAVQPEPAQALPRAASGSRPVPVDEADCCEQTITPAYPESPKRPRSHVGRMMDSAPTIAETYSVFSTTLSAASMTAATFGILGAFLGPVFAALAAVGVAQAGLEFYRKAHDD